MHVNGYFELSSNRRSIWYSDVASDLAGEGARALGLEHSPRPGAQAPLACLILPAVQD